MSWPVDETPEPIGDVLSCQEMGISMPEPTVPAALRRLRTDSPTSGGGVAPRDEQIGEPEQHGDTLRVLRQPPIAHLRVAEVALHIQERMFHPGPNRRLAPLRRRLRACLVQPRRLPGFSATSQSTSVSRFSARLSTL